MKRKPDEGPETVNSKDLRNLDSTELVRLCARDRNDSALWSEFLRRFTARMQRFIHGALRQALADRHDVAGTLAPDAPADETDLFQNMILRLVDNDCAALRRFSGTAECDLMVYFAVIARSVVRDHLRRLRAQKRPPPTGISRAVERMRARESGALLGMGVNSPEFETFSHEISRLSLRALQSQPARDQLIFQLHFSDELTASQIAECKGIGLSKTGVEKVLERLKTRVRNIAADR